MKPTPRAFVATLLSAPLLLVGCGSSSNTPDAGSAPPPAGSTFTASNPPATTTSIGIDNFAFGPDNVTAADGTTVTWTNDQSVVHTVTADDGSFDSGDIAAGGTFENTFDGAGTFLYHCSIHSNMTGTIIVQ